MTSYHRDQEYPGLTRQEAEVAQLTEDVRQLRNSVTILGAVTALTLAVLIFLIVST